MKNLLLACAILFTVSCGSKNETTAKDPNLNRNGNQTCSQQENFTSAKGCIPQQQRGHTSWLLKTKFKKFPAKVRVKINGVVVADECSSRRRRTSYSGRVSRSQNSSEADIFVPSFMTPLNGRVQVEIIKLGKKCFWWSSFFYQGNTRFTVGNVSTSRPAAIEVHLPQ
jgi:hypothetical protein